MKPIRTLLATAAAALLAALPVAAQTQQGVSKTEILIASIQDLSGPIAAWGKQVRAGMQLRIDEVNEQGGIHGRKVRLLVEDSGYDPKRAVLAAQKLVNQEKIFMMVGHIGSAQNMAAMPVQFDKNIVNFFPLSSAREMYEPHHRLKYALQGPYFDQLRITLPRLIKEKKATKVCALYQDDEFGLEVMRGGEAGLKAMGLDYTEKTTYKRGATDFSSQVAKLKAANCDLVVMGTIIRETIGTIAESRKNGFNPTFLGSAAAYTEVIHKLGGPAMNGFYATMTTINPYIDDASPQLRFWSNKLKTKFNEDPSVFAAYGYAIVDSFIAAANKAGANLTTDSFIKAMDTMVIEPDIFGSPRSTFSPTKRLGSDQSRLSQIVDGRWKIVWGYDGK